MSAAHAGEVVLKARDAIEGPLRQMDLRELDSMVGGDIQRKETSQASDGDDDDDEGLHGQADIPSRKRKHLPSARIVTGPSPARVLPTSSARFGNSAKLLSPDAEATTQRVRRVVTRRP